MKSVQNLREGISIARKDSDAEVNNLLVKFRC